MGAYAVGLLLMVAQGTANKGMAVCATIPVPAERLECYDRLAGRTATPIASPPTPAASGDSDSFDGWKVQASASAIDDSKIVWSSLLSTTKNATLVVQCRGKKKETDVLIKWAEAVGPEDDEEVHVTIRLGISKPSDSEWQISQDHRTTFYMGSTKDLARRIIGGTQLVAQVSSYGAVPVVATFGLAGAGEAIGKVKQACGWKD